MKLISSELRSHLDGEVTTLCRCWVIERTDGVKLGFTDHDETLLVSKRRSSGCFMHLYGYQPYVATSLLS